jgi:hypothetical protein
MRAAAGEHAPVAVARFAATQRVTIQAVHVPVQATQQLHIAAVVVDMPAAVVVVVDMPAVAVVVDMPAAVADTSNL